MIIVEICAKAPYRISRYYLKWISDVTISKNNGSDGLNLKTMEMAEGDHLDFLHSVRIQNDFRNGLCVNHLIGKVVSGVSRTIFFWSTFLIWPPAAMLNLDVYTIVYSCVDQRKHQSSASLAFVRIIHRRPVNSPHKWPVTQKKFPFDDVIMFRHYVQLALSHYHNDQSVIEYAVDYLLIHQQSNPAKRQICTKQKACCLKSWYFPVDKWMLLKVKHLIQTYLLFSFSTSHCFWYSTYS